MAFVCLKVTNDYSESFVSFHEKLREKYPKSVIMAGNVVTGEMVEELILSGADIVKIGIGPGSVCTTREKTGVGYPQLSAIIDSQVSQPNFVNAPSTQIPTTDYAGITQQGFQHQMGLYNTQMQHANALLGALLGLG